GICESECSAVSRNLNQSLAPAGSGCADLPQGFCDSFATPYNAIETWESGLEAFAILRIAGRSQNRAEITATGYNPSEGWHLEVVERACSSAVEQGTHNPLVGGSNPSGPTNSNRSKPCGMRGLHISSPPWWVEVMSNQTPLPLNSHLMRGWRSYFGFCETPYVLIQLTRWVRLRLRAAMWRQWKTPRRRRAALLALGVRPRLASNTAGSGLGPWYLARAKALSVGLSNAYFKSLGLPTLIDGC